MIGEWMRPLMTLSTAGIWMEICRMCGQPDGLVNAL